MGEDGQKMSKSLGNVVNPDDIINEFGADVLRLYEMFMGPLEQSKPWSMKNISGTRRFLEKVWRIAEKPIVDSATPPHIEKMRHQTIKKVSAEIEAYKFNTAISQLMIYANEFGNEKSVTRPSLETLLILLAPFAPHLTEELWEKIGNTFSIHQRPWPSYDEAFLVEDKVTVVFMVNGKLRDSRELSSQTSKEELEAMASNILAKHIDGKTVVKMIVVPGKLVNLVVK
jgi:leucyl-tRNA synthetase